MPGALRPICSFHNTAEVIFEVAFLISLSLLAAAAVARVLSRRGLFEEPGASVFNQNVGSAPGRERHVTTEITITRSAMSIGILLLLATSVGLGPECLLLEQMRP
jgi:hypothetical protein